MRAIYFSLTMLVVFTVISGWVGHKEPANIPFCIFFAAALIVFAIWGAVRETNRVKSSLLRRVPK